MHTIENMFATGISTIVIFFGITIGTYIYMVYADTKPKLCWFLIGVLVFVVLLVNYYLLNWFVDIGWVVPCQGSECNATKM